jgi:hypothetical protein
MAMAGQSGRNTNIARSRLGCRLPYEHPGIGDGYASAGPVITYTLSPEELARYGPPRRRKDRDLTRGAVSFALKHAASLEHAAKIARVSEARMKREMARHCVAVPEEWKEEKPMEDTQVYEISDNAGQGNPENKGFKVYEEQQPPKRPKTRLEVAREKLSREMYLDMRAEGLSDREISKNALGKYMADVITKLKKEYGLTGVGFKAGAENMPAPNQASEPTITIAQAITLQGDLDVDIDAINYILDVAKDQLTPRVEKLLTDALEGAKKQVERINKAFNTTKIKI